MFEHTLVVVFLWYLIILNISHTELTTTSLVQCNTYLFAIMIRNIVKEWLTSKTNKNSNIEYATKICLKNLQFMSQIVLLISKKNIQSINCYNQNLSCANDWIMLLSSLDINWLQAIIDIFYLRIILIKNSLKSARHLHFCSGYISCNSFNCRNYELRFYM